MMELLIQYNIINVDNNESIFYQCLKRKAKNILEFIINNYPEIIHTITISSTKKNIRIYRFIKMLINRNIIDIPD